MNRQRYCVIMAGGVGSRFWPISRRTMPKQFLDILGTGKSFIRHTYERFARIIPPENFLVITNSLYKDQVLEHLPELQENQILCEPIGRNTAPAVAYSAWRLQAMDPQATMIVTPADHLILNEAEFCEVITEGAEFVEQCPALMTIGIRPSRPDTGYGYIQIEPEVDPAHPAVSRVKTFTEKPNLELAKVFVDSGEFFWNAGIFIWKVSTIMANLNEFLPETQQLFASIAPLYNTPEEQQAINTVYAECRSISIDYGVMEKTRDAYVRRSDFGWSDIGTWGSLYQNAPKDEHGNVCYGKTLTYDTQHCIINSAPGKLTVIDSLDNYIVVDTPDVLMICPKANEQNIKVFVDDVKFKLGDEYI